MLKGFSYFLMPVIIVIISVFLMAGNTTFYHYEFNKNSTYTSVDLPREAIPEVVDHLAGYVVGKYSTFNHKIDVDGKMQEVYGEREVQHMQDVRAIFDTIKYIGIFGMGLIFLNLFKMRGKGLVLSYLFNLSKWGLIGVSVIIAGLGLLVSIDFSKYFIIFHEIFFTNDLWLLNPKTDVLIQMLPEVFFMDMAIFIMILSFVLALLFFALLTLVNKRKQARETLC